MAVTILSLGLLYFLSRYFQILFVKIKIPDILLLTFFGIFLGPVFHIVEKESFGQVGAVLTTISLVIILFESGISTSIKEVIDSAGLTTKVTFLTSIGTLILSGILLYHISQVGSSFEWLSEYSSFSWAESFLFGAIICGTSSAVVIPMVKLLKMTSSLKEVLVMESALTDVLCIVLAVAFTGFALPEGHVEVGKILGSTISSLLFATVIGFVCGILWLRILSKFVEMKKTLFTTIAFTLIVYGAAEFLGFSGAIAAMALGLTMNNHQFLRLVRWLRGVTPADPITDNERNLYSELVFLLKTFFFIYLGIGMPFKNWQPHLIAISILVCLYFFRALVIVLMRKYSNLKADRRELWIAAVMIPKGLAAAVLAAVPAQMGVSKGGQIEEITYAIVLHSIIATAALLWFSEFQSGRKEQSRAQ